MKKKGELAKGGEDYRKSLKHDFNKIATKKGGENSKGKPKTNSDSSVKKDRTPKDKYEKSKSNAKTLKQIGITRKESSQSQKLQAKERIEKHSSLTPSWAAHEEPFFCLK